MVKSNSDDEDKEDLVGITFRIAEPTMERMKKLAKIEKTKVASILRRLSNRYVGFGVIAERRREHSMPRDIVKILFSELSDEQMKAIEEKYFRIALNDLKARYTQIDCKTVESALMTWARYNDLHFNIEKGNKGNEFWILCQHAFGKNWAISFSRVITRLLQYNNQCMVIQNDLEADEYVLRIHYRLGVELDQKEL